MSKKWYDPNRVYPIFKGDTAFRRLMHAIQQSIIMSFFMSIGLFMLAILIEYFPMVMGVVAILILYIIVGFIGIILLNLIVNAYHKRLK